MSPPPARPTCSSSARRSLRCSASVGAILVLDLASGKTVRLLDGHPAIAYTIAPAVESGVFDAVMVSTDSEEIAAIARHYGAEVPFLRPASFAGDTSPDIEWLDYTIRELAARGRAWDCFALLRPTSPFRSADTIRRVLAPSEPGGSALPLGDALAVPELVAPSDHSAERGVARW